MGGEREPSIDRRQFLKRMKGMFIGGGALATFGVVHGYLDVKKENKETKAEGLSRRNFLKFTAALGGVLLLGTEKAEAVDQSGKGGSERKIDEYFARAVENYKPIREADNSKVETLVETSLLMLGETIANEAFQRAGFKTSPTFKEMKEWGDRGGAIDKVIETFAGISYKPLIEEAVFRLIPSEYLAGRVGKGSREKRWDIGIPMSAIFALGHNIQRKNSSDILPRFTSFKEFVPFSHFMSGVFYWYLIREKGYNHAFLAHAAHNAEVYALGELLSRIFPIRRSEAETVNSFQMNESEPPPGS